MKENDGDIVRGLGFVTLYSAYLEEQIDDLLFLLSSIEEIDEKKQRLQISRKIEHAKQLIRSLETSEFDELIDDLEYCTELFERRNEVVHGRVYANFNRPDALRSGRPNVPERKIESSELYDLANECDSMRRQIYRPMIFELPRYLAENVR